MLKENIHMAMDSIKHRKMRAFLTVLGILIGIAAIVALISLGDGFKNAINDQFSKMGTENVMVVPKGLRGPPTGTQGLTTADVKVVENVRGVEYVSPLLAMSENVEYGRKKIYGQISCYESDIMEKTLTDMNRKVVDGRLLNNGEKGGVVIGYKLAKDDFDKEVMVRNSIYIKDEKFRVVGVFEETGSNEDHVILMDMEDCRRLMGKDKEVSMILMHTAKGFDVEAVAKDAQNKLKRARDNENFEVYTPAQLLKQLNDILSIVSAILTAIAAISLVVGGMGIMNSMYTNVLERTRDIGVMKAIGAKRSQILMIFLVEAGMYGLAGGLIGVSLGMVISKMVETVAVYGFGFTLLKIKMDFMLIGEALLFSFLVGCISGLLPSIRASKLKPAEALRYE